MTREEMQRQLDDDRAAVVRAREESRRISRRLKKSRRVRRDSLPKIKNARQAS